jgi:ribosomal protein S18 acetylase RimI-like enzyme
LLEFLLATQGDARAIAALHTQSWQQHYQGLISDDYLRTELAADRLAIWQQRLGAEKHDYWVLLAKRDNQLVGFVCINNIEHPDGVLLDNLHVASRFHGTGIGLSLFKQAAEYVRVNFESVPMYLEVLSKNQRAIAFYKSLGGQFIRNGSWRTPCGNCVDEQVYSWQSNTLKQLAGLA